MSNYNSNYEIAQAISERIGASPIPFDSVYEICLQIYNELGGEPSEFDSVYEILLGILPLVEGGITSNVIDDSVIATNKTWSSSKIASIPQLEEGDNISIESSKINAKGYRFDEKNNAFAELGNKKTAFELAYSWEEAVGVDPELYISGAANTTTYTIDVAYATINLKDFVFLIQQFGGGLVMANGEKRLITSLDETFTSVTFDRTLDAENAVENMKVTAVYVPVSLSVSGDANATTYSWTSTKPQVVLEMFPDQIIRIGTDVLFDDYGAKKITKLTEQTISFDSTLDANNSISNVQPSGFVYYVNSAIGKQSHAEGAAMAIGAYSHAEGCNFLDAQSASFGKWIVSSGTYSWNSDDDYTTLIGVVSADYLKVGDIVRYGDVIRRVDGKDGNNLIIDRPFNLSDTKDAEIEYYLNGTFAYGMGSHAEGGKSKASDDFSHAEGYGGVAAGFASHAEGYGGVAAGYASHVEGGHRDHRLGDTHTASGRYSHAEGDSTNATGSASHAEGFDTLAQNTAEHAEGCYNVSHKANSNQISDKYPNGDAGNTQHSIGIGYSGFIKVHRKNAVEVMTNGDMYVLGVGGYQGTDTKVQNATIKTLQEYIASLEARIAALEGNSTV